MNRTGQRPHRAMPRRIIASWALASATLVLAACGSEVSPPANPAPDSRGQAQAKSAAQDVVPRTVEVTLTEGTNMAVTVDAANNNRVISLQGQLFLLPAQGDARAITDAYFDAREPQLGSDGTSVVFHGYRNGNWDIWRADTHGAPPVALTNDAFDDREPQWSADQASVVFSSDRSGSYDIWRLNLASGELQQLTRTPANNYSPSLHPSGGLAYVATRGGRSWVYADDKALVEHAGTIAGVQWSPDGSHISYQLHSGTRTQMRLLAVNDGSDRVISAPGADVFPFRASWLDDNQLVYTANGLMQRHTLQPAATKVWPMQVTVSLTRHDYARRQRDYDPQTTHQAKGIATPVIDSTGEHIYFAALGDLWHWQPGTQSLVQITDSPAAEFALALHGDDRQLAYVSDVGGRLGLYVRDLTSGQSRRIDLDASQISMPSWSPEGSQLAFFVDVPGNPLGGQLMVLDLASGKLTPVLDPMPAQPTSWSADGTRLAVTRLNPYSSRYREGIYELVVSDWRSNRQTIVSPLPHQSISNAVLTPDQAMTYVQGGLLHRLELDDNYQALEAAGQVTDELTDMPAWSSNGQQLVYLHGDRLKRLTRSSGEVTDITPQLPYRQVAPQRRYVVRAGRVFTGQGDTYLRDQDIVIQGSRISAVQPSDPAITPDIDASHLSVIPGLFEMHAHMGELSEVQGRIWLSNGVTTVRDPGSNPHVAKARQEGWDSGRSIGPRTHITGYLTDGNRVYYSMAEGIVSAAHLQMALQRTAQLQLDFIKTYVRLPDHWQREVVNFAHGIGIPVSSHELYPAIAHGMDHVEHIGGTSRRGYQPKVSRLGYSYQDVIDLLGAGGMGLTATAVLPGFSVIVTEQPDWFDTRQFEHFYGAAARRAYQVVVQRFGAGAAETAQANGKLLRALTDNGALLVTGTDSPFVPYGSGLHAELRLYARAGLSPAQILHQATLRSAQAAGVADELGSIEPGKLADLVLIDGDPLANIGDADNVVTTIKHGFVYPLDELLTTPE